MSIMKAPRSGVAVRMYRQGLGDCFLLAFASGSSAKPYYMLIDCGVLVGTPDAETKMNAVVEDIASVTGGDIHLLVITHEHWDHLSGFLQAREVFERMNIHNVWFAWTQKPGDPLAEKLRDKFERDRQALHLALSQITHSSLRARIESLAMFFGELSATGRKTTKEALEQIQQMGDRSSASTTYLRPGDLVTALPTANKTKANPSPRVFVLGPPYDERSLMQSKPSSAAHEVYSDESSLTQRAAATAITEDPGLPFDPHLSLGPDEMRQHKFFLDHYGYPEEVHPDPSKTTPSSNTEELWRRIEYDWIDSATSELALKMDSDTNNTSLVLAIELPVSRKVLLFVGDAQVGNWLSWDPLRWASKDVNNQEVSVDDLLRRTVLYKVGHHGSHNATIRSDKTGMSPKGLELMEHPDLVAMLPVNQVTAEKVGWGHMPFDPLLRRLSQKTLGRVMRSDTPFNNSSPDGMSATVWQNFKRDYVETDLYMQFTVNDEVN